MRQDVRVAMVAGVAALGTAGGALALFGLGVPYALGALMLSALAGLLVRTALPGPDPAPAARLVAVEAALAALRHDVRGALSPALMMSDRLLASPDPAIVRAGQAVVKSVERATLLLNATKEPTPPAHP